MKPRPLLCLSLAPIRSYNSSSIPQCRPFSYASTAPPSKKRHPNNYSRYTPAHDAHTLQQRVRYASAAATARKAIPATYSSNLKPKTSVPAKSPSSRLPIPQVRAKVNPPPETYAPDLQIPARKGQNFFKYLYRCGRLYISFYKQGIKNVRSTTKIANALRATRARAPAADRDTVLTRAEWQTVRRNATDKLRLPAFVVLVLVFGEWMPLLALYITPVVPEPCRIPAQIERAHRKREEWRQERERRLAMDATRLVARDRKPGMTNPGTIRPQAVKLEELDKAGLYTLLSLSIKLDCHSAWWEYLFLTPPKGLLRWSLKKKIEYLQRDDALIRRDGGWQALNSNEIERACMERGIRTLGRNEHDLRKELGAWFER